MNEAETLANIENLLSGDGLDSDSIIKIAIYRGTFDDFDKFNVLHVELVGSHSLSHTTVEVSLLLKGALLVGDVSALCK